MIALAVRRPVATLAAVATIALLGGRALHGIPLGLLPEPSFPRLRIETWWPGAAPDVVEAAITAPLEAAAHEVEGVRAVESVSRAHLSEVLVDFAPGTDLRLARLDLAERAAAVARGLPPGSGPPRVRSWAPAALDALDEPLAVLVLEGSVPPGALRRTARRSVVPALEAVEGVDRVLVVGGADPAVRVTLDPVRLAALGLDPMDVRRVVEAEATGVAGGGLLVVGGIERTLSLPDRPRSIADLAALVVRPTTTGLAPIRLRDVARVERAWTPAPLTHRADGRTAVLLHLRAAPGANAVRASGRVRDALPALARALPPGHRISVERDAGAVARGALADLARRSALAAAVVAGVLWIAFGGPGPALLAGGLVLVTALVAAALVRAAGLALDVPTLAGVGTAFGLVVDHAVVVLEGAERANGPPVARALRGARRALPPLVAATTTTLAVLVPVPFLGREARAVYAPFAGAVAAVLASGLALALTALPSIAARTVLRAPRRAPPAGRTRRAHARLLRASLAHPRAVAMVALALVTACAALFATRVPRGEVWIGPPDETWVTVRIAFPPGFDGAAADRAARGLEARIARLPGVARIVTESGPGFALLRVGFPEALARTAVPLAARERIVALGRDVGGADVRVHGLGRAFQAGVAGPPPYAFEIRGPRRDVLERVALDVAGRLARHPRVGRVDHDASGRWTERRVEEEARLVPDRERLEGAGATVEAFVTSVESRTGSGHPGPATVALADGEVPLVFAVADGGRVDVRDLPALDAGLPGGARLRIGQAAGIEVGPAAGRIVRRRQAYERVVAWEFRGSPRLGDRTRDAVLAATALPPGYAIKPARAAGTMERGEEGRLARALVFAVGCVFLLTAALLESLRAPLVVLAAVPPALAGVAATWLISGETFGREAWIGAILASGVAVNGAILVVDRIGAEGARGPREAALAATMAVARPVLVTTATTVLGLLPFVLGTDPATAGPWRPLALATIGGTLASTAFVLGALPAVHVLLAPGFGRSR